MSGMANKIGTVPQLSKSESWIDKGSIVQFSLYIYQTRYTFKKGLAKTIQCFIIGNGKLTNNSIYYNSPRLELQWSEDQFRRIGLSGLSFLIQPYIHQT